MCIQDVVLYYLLRKCVVVSVYANLCLTFVGKILDKPEHLYYSVPVTMECVNGSLVRTGSRRSGTATSDCRGGGTNYFFKSLLKPNTRTIVNTHLMFLKTCIHI